jgi:hypothetical protein
VGNRERWKKLRIMRKESKGRLSKAGEYKLFKIERTI